MDAQQIAWNCSISAAVLGKGEEFVLCPLDEPTPASEALARAHGYVFCGVMGYDPQAGRSIAKCEDPDSVITMMHAAFAFAQFVAARLKPKSDWLEKLWELPDTRTEN
jgi:hypothetical protein